MSSQNSRSSSLSEIESESKSQDNEPRKSLVLVLIACFAFGVFYLLSDSQRKYYDDNFWATASLSDVELLSDESLLPGNRKGSILMWASAGATDPNIIAAIIKRGVDVDEADAIFSGTPMSAAAAFSNTPETIDVLVSHGAQINKVVGSKDKTPLIIAAELNFNPEIAKRLLHHGADVNYQDTDGKNAYQRAVQFKNKSVMAIIDQHKQDIYSSQQN